MEELSLLLLLLWRKEGLLKVRCHQSAFSQVDYVLTRLCHQMEALLLLLLLLIRKTELCVSHAETMSMVLLLLFLLLLMLLSEEVEVGEEMYPVVAEIHVVSVVVVIHSVVVVVSVSLQTRSI